MKKLFTAFVLLVAFTANAQKPELVIPTRHAETVEQVLYTKDGKYILSASENIVKVWETSSGRLIKNIVCRWGEAEPMVVDMDNAPDGKTVAIATYRNIHFFSLDNFSVLKEIHMDEISKIIYSKDGSELFVAHGESAEEMLSKITINNGNITPLYTHKVVKDENGISNISLSKDGKQLLACLDKDGTIIVNSSNGQEIKNIPAEKKVIAFTPDDNYLTVGKGKQTYDVLFEWLNPATLQPLWSATIAYEDGDGILDFLSDESSFRRQLAWNPANNDLLIASQHHLFTISFGGRTQAKLKFEADGYGKCIAAAQDGRRIVLGTSTPAVNEYNLAQQKYIRRYGSQVFITATMQSASDSSMQLLLNSDNGNINDLRFDRTNFAAKGKRTDNSFSVSALTKNGKLGAYFFQHSLHFFDPATMKDAAETIDIEENFDLQEMDFSANGKWLTAVHEKYVLVFDVTAKKLVAKIATGVYELGTYNNFKIAGISGDGKKLITYSIKENSNGSGSILCFDVTTGKLLWEKGIVACCFRFINSDKQVWMLQKDNPAVLTLDAATGNTVSEKRLPFERIFAAAVSSDLSRVAFSVTDQNFSYLNSDIQVWDITKNERIAVLKGHEFTPGDLEFLANANFLVSASRDYSTRIWDIKNQRELGKLITFEGSDEWVFITPDGRFDASPGALQTMYYTKGKEVLPLEALYEQYYTPKLVSRLLAGEQFDPVPDIANIKVRPSAKMTYAAATRNLSVEDDMPTYQNTTGVAEITVTAIAPGDAIDEIRLFQNGKVVTLSTRNLIVADDNTANTGSKKYTVNLLPGENTFRAVALNTQRTESAPDEIAVIYNAGDNNNKDSKIAMNNTEGAPIAAIDRNAIMHLIVVGINKYQNQNMRLNYALADATSFKEEVEKDAKSVIANIKTYFITDNAADKGGITDALKQVQQNAKANDVFVFYYAGHGVIGKDNEFYLVPADVSDLKNVQSELEQKGISAKLLQQYAINIQAQKQLFILDACQSAGAFGAMLTSDATQQKNIAVVARSTGTHWIAASGAQQFANEFSSLGHGAFTYVLLEALKGAAAADDMITVNNLKNYLQLTVPDLMKKYHGTPQYPASYGFGNDFPVEIKK
ncbi:MAG TPA: caspase family protein [Panacibacter sp.]|nr:caspase family protein [Panacibacter sp.]HNP44723.1 caspase family protein [Panacibacter sp.]